MLALGLDLDRLLSALVTSGAIFAVIDTAPLLPNTRITSTLLPFLGIYLGGLLGGNGS